MKKIVSFVLALTLALALSLTAFADTPTSQNMEVEYTVDPSYVVIIPDGGDGLVVDPDTGSGEMDIGIKEKSLIPGNKAIQMSINAGKHYDNTKKTYQMKNSTGGQLLAYVLKYKGEVKNPNSSDSTVVLETISADEAYSGYSGKIGINVGTAKAAGTYTDTLTFTFALVNAVS